MQLAGESFLRCSFLVGLAVAGASQNGLAAQKDSYLPVGKGIKWVLKNQQHNATVTFEVTGPAHNGYLFTATYPWGKSEWVLEPDGDRLLMTRFGMGRGLMTLDDRPVFVDFGRGPASSWKNSLGTLEMDRQAPEVRTADAVYGDTKALRHRPNGGAAQYYVFARGIGFVQFGEGKNAFLLDARASNLEINESPASSTAPAPSGAPVRSAEPAAPSRRTHGGSRPGPLPVGLTFNTLANEPKTPQNLLKRFDQTLEAGISLLVGGASWAELEPRSGQIRLDDIRYLASVAQQRRIPVVYTLKLIDTIHKSVPPDLRQEPWNSPRMKARAVQLVEALAPVLKSELQWFHFGYEVDGYFQGRPQEVEAFTDLYRTVADRLRQLRPGIQISSTLAYVDLAAIQGRLSPLNREWDHLAITYTPMVPGWIVQDPSVVPNDFARMKQAANGRGILLQELAYPTSPLNEGSQEKQAEFYQLAFDALRRDRQSFLAANFMMLADLSDEETSRFGEFYGLPRDRKFKAMLQTLGMFDVDGRPKKGWDVFLRNMARK